ncbi:MAG: CDP-alcohol phosphatidyltransferase family protein [Sphingobacteriales bacterium]|nr:MAG: CDP-alcohol phosphatidyltransferase family protein [Sphingobacteriales bacterium]
MNSTEEYKVAERRPITTRNLAVSHRAADWLAARGVTANAISTAGLAPGILGGLAFAATSQPQFPVWLCWLLGAVFVQLRLLANMLDGMVAIRSGKASAVGELYNEVPDRVSDAATLIGLGYAMGSHVALGYIATCVALFVAYVRAMGKVAGAHQEFCGPMAKPQRMAAVTVVALVCAVLPAAMAWQLPAIALAVIAVGGGITSLRRLSRISKALRAA